MSASDSRHPPTPAWHLDEDALESVALGAGILGTGGGGNPRVGMLRAREIVRRHGPVPVMGPGDLVDDDRVICVGGMGAPTVGVEKVRSTESHRALRAMEEVAGVRATAVISGEIGGSNSLEPVVAAGPAGLPVVDGDGMGRAFPELQMTTYFIYGIEPAPAVLCDEKGNTAVFRDAISPRWLERMARAVTVAMGCVPVFAFRPMTAEEVRRTAIPGTLTRARALGDAVRGARRDGGNPVEAILETVAGTVLFLGKIVDVERRTTEGFTRGRVELSGLDEDRGSKLEVEFQNENLVARRNGEVVFTVPDLICLVDADRGEPVTTELLRYGYRVAVLGFPAPQLLRTPEALAVVGPGAFGYDVAYRPFEP